MTLKSRFDNAEMRSLLKLMAVSPLLCVTDTLGKSLVIGGALVLTLLIAELIVSLLRKKIPSDTRFAVCFVITVFAASVTELLMKICVPQAVDALGVYLPILAVSCIVILRLEYACEMTVGAALEDAIVCGGEFLLLTLATGFIRELFGRGTVGCSYNGDGGLTMFPSAPLPILTLPAGVLLLAAFGTAIIKGVNNAKNKKKGENK